MLMKFLLLRYAAKKSWVSFNMIGAAICEVSTRNDLFSGGVVQALGPKKLNQLSYSLFQLFAYFSAF